MSIAETLEAAAAELDAVEARTTEAGVEWATAGIAFAALAGETAEFRLAPLVGRAALGTGDARPSSRGADWVAFSPREFDRVAQDRAVAWFGSAWRSASTARESTRPRSGDRGR